MSQEAGKLGLKGAPASARASRSRRSRWARFRPLLAFLPALGAVALVAGGALGTSWTDRDWVQTSYTQKAWRALRARDYPRARVCFERLASEPHPAPDVIYGLAMTLQGQGETSRSLRLLARAAPSDRPGFAPAHLELARILLARAATDPQVLVDAERHLRLAIDSSSAIVEPADTRVQAEGMLGQLYAGTGKPVQAIPFLASASEHSPTLRIALARAYHDAGQPGVARDEAEHAAREFLARLVKDPDDLSSRLHAAEAFSLRNDYAAAVGVLEQGLKRSNDPRLRSSISHVYAAWSDAVGRGEADPRSGDRLALLGRGLQVDPASRPLLERLGRVLESGSRDAAEARETLRGLLTQGRAAPTAHFLLGVDAWVRGDVEAARTHLEAADRLDAGSPLVANNLAWVLAHSTPADLPRALKLADLALERKPGFARFRGTRGDILTRLGRWREALPDLESGLTVDPDNADLHRDLAETYDHLGDPSMAARHRNHASPARVKTRSGPRSGF